MKCSYCNKEIENINSMIKGLHSSCAMEVTNAYCFAHNYELRKSSKDG